MASRSITRTDTWSPTARSSAAATILRYLARNTPMDVFQARLLEVAEKDIIPPSRVKDLLQILRDIGIPTAKAESAVVVKDARKCVRCDSKYHEFDNHPEACMVPHSHKCDKDKPVRMNCWAFCSIYAGTKARHTTQHAPNQVVKVYKAQTRIAPP